MIVQELYKIQSRCGYLPDEELRQLADRLRVPLYRIEEVRSFFPHFRSTPPPKCHVHVCRDMSCRLRGSLGMLAKLNEALQDDNVEVTPASCLGRCDRAPAAYVAAHGDQHEERYYYGRDPNEMVDIVMQTAAGTPPNGDSDEAHRPEDHRNWQIDIYQHDQTLDPFSAVKQFIQSSNHDDAREQVLKSLETAMLLGMGGAGGRAFKKWRDVLNARGTEKYVVCNADESEPGTFKDRELLLRTPHLVLEGMILGALVVGAQRGYVYVRHEYPEQIASVNNAIQQAERLGACGDGIFGSSFRFELEVFVSPGGYICGEQTALIEAMEDRRAEPRNRPPELQTNGLYDKPTLLNNVETFAWVPAVAVKDSGQWYAEQGADGSRGMRFFSVSGDVTRPGVYEVPIGITLAELLERCGGMRDGKPPKAFALSGPSGGMVPPVIQGKQPIDLLNTKLDLSVFRRMRQMLGAGIVVYGSDANLLDQAAGCLEFYRDESCGKCVPCRIGTNKLAIFGNQLRDRQISAEEAASARLAIDDLADTMSATAICGLGQIAANPITTLLDHFPEEWE